MNVTAQEKLMYGVMKAVYDSGIPVSFKGSMVLKACLAEAGYAEETRHTVDIDGNWHSETPPSAEEMVGSFQRAVTRAGIDLRVRIYRMYGEGRSAGFELMEADSDDVIFTMDIDVNRPVGDTRIYEVDAITFRGNTAYQMIADKVAAISSEKVFRRIKDVVDLYYLAHVFKFEKQAILEKLINSGRTLDSFEGFMTRKEDLRHSYEKFRFAGDVGKPEFEEVYQTVRAFIADILPDS